MKAFTLGLLNDLMSGMLFILACEVSSHSIIFGALAFFIAFIGLDVHTYFSKKLNFYNNLFIK